MSVQSLAKFVQDVSTDRNLERRFDAALAGSSDKQAALIAFAASEGYSFDPKEIAAIVATERAISDEALDKVAGGFNPQPEPPGGYQQGSHTQQSQYTTQSQVSQYTSFLASKGIIIVNS